MAPEVRPAQPPQVSAWVQVEAIACILAARGAIRWIRVPRLIGTYRRDVVQAQGDARVMARAQVKRAVFLVTRRGWPRSTCLHRALAAYWMLRRRRVLTTLRYGARSMPGRGLSGHAWLTDGDSPIVGFDAAEGYPLLGQFPADYPA